MGKRRDLPSRSGVSTSYEGHCFQSHRSLYPHAQDSERYFFDNVARGKLSCISLRPDFEALARYGTQL